MTYRAGGASEHDVVGIRQLQVWLALTDLAVIAWATFGAQLIRFGIKGRSGVAAHVDGGFDLSYTSFSLGLILVWWLALCLHRVYDRHILGYGTAEYRWVVVGSLRVFALVALLAFALQVQVARGYILLALPAGVLGMVVARRMWRRWLGGRRQVGELSNDVLVVGDASHASDLIGAFRANPEAGFRVIGACSSGSGDRIDGVPVLGTEHHAARVAMELGVDVVACTASHHLGVDGLRRLGWALEGSGIELVVAPGLTEVAGPRVVSRPVAGLPLLHVEAPQFDGPKLVLKSTIDWVGALALVILFSPLMLLVAAAIKLHDGGPVFFRQRRVGLEGAHFQMTKFRSMAVDAEARLAEVRALQEAAARSAGGDDGAPVVDRGVLFKMEDDPRVTPIGRFIRRYSIDELPQLFDVLAGKMSLVGPRPPLPSEVQEYEHDVHRRLLVRPGLTGLWQINGRSDLTWDEAVRFDLYYVENWSVSQDMIILWRTLAAVLGRRGAY